MYTWIDSGFKPAYLMDLSTFPYSSSQRTKTHFQWLFNEGLLRTRQCTWNPEVWLSVLRDLCLWLWQVTSLSFFLYLGNGGGCYMWESKCLWTILPFIHKVIAFSYKDIQIILPSKSTQCSENKYHKAYYVIMSNNKHWGVLCLHPPQCDGDDGKA